MIFVARACGHSSGFQDDADELDHGFEALVGFVVPGGDTAEILEVAEEVFNQVSPLVHLKIARNGNDPVGFGRDHRRRAAVVQIGSDRIGVERFVGQQSGEIEIVEKGGDAHAVVSGNKTKRTRLPNASTRATILVVKPPRDRPMA
jgi:hypothetical protein